MFSMSCIYAEFERADIIKNVHFTIDKLRRQWSLLKALWCRKTFLNTLSYLSKKLLLM